jgi:hypothetical protein
MCRNNFLTRNKANNAVAQIFGKTPIPNNAKCALLGSNYNARDPIKPLLDVPPDSAAAFVCA